MNSKDLQHSSWIGIWSLSLSLSAIMIGQFLPSGILTLMAQDLGISEGVAGQTVTATSVGAVLSSIFLPTLTKAIDRRLVLISLATLTSISCFIIWGTTSYPILVGSMGLMGIALGGLWALAAALAIRLVKNEDKTKALAIIFGTASFSSMLAAPLGSFLGELVYWRNIFAFNGIYSFLCAAFIFFCLPSLPPQGTLKLRSFLKVLKIPSVKVGLLATGLVFCGRFASTTYLRPYLEQDVQLSGYLLSGMFLIFDLSYFLGAFYAANLAKKNLRVSLYIPPIVLALTSFGLIQFNNYVIIVGIFLFIRGIAFAPLPVSWSTWGTLIAPENTETIGSLYVASVQLSAMVGAALGGVIFDHFQATGVFHFSNLVWLLSSIIVFKFVKTAFSTQEESQYA